MKDEENCIFCKIIKGKIPAKKVYDNERIMAFLDISPVNKGHTLIVPKAHSRNLIEDSDEDLAACMAGLKKIAPAIMRAVNSDGFNLIANTNKAAGQAVFHTHFHVIPRFEGDGLKHWPQKSYQEEEIESIRLKIENEIR